jgi:UDPglucose 6-dehydrogenase
VKGMRIALWGLAFKPNTDDMREAPSGVVIQGLLDRGATVVAYDPVATEAAQLAFGPLEGLGYAKGQMQALDGAAALMIVTEWKEFRSPDFEVIRAKLAHPVIFDGRNMYEPEMVRSFGLEYHAIGRP